MSPSERPIPTTTVSRLPLYLRALERLLELGESTVPSEKLAEVAGVSAANLRKDLATFGSFGTRGSGYDIKNLKVRIASVLGADTEWKVAIAGIGNLGLALANYPILAGPSFMVAALFDTDNAKIGTKILGMPIRHIDEMPLAVAEENLRMGVITTPAGVAQDVANKMMSSGIKSILNFAPALILAGEGVLVRNVDVALHLLVLSYHERSGQNGTGLSRNSGR